MNFDLKNIPSTSGIYIFRDSLKKIIYVGKAVNLRSRVGSYFNSVKKDPKTEVLVSLISDLEYIETESEVGALLLESEMIKRYKPKYNIELKDNKNFLYLKIPKEDFPLPVFIRNPEDDKATYLGPFLDPRAVRRVLKMLRKVFPFRSAGDLNAKKPCLYYHLGQCPGVCIGAITKSEYKKNIRGILAFFEGKSKKIIKGFEKEMKRASKEKDFEKAVVFRDKIKDINKINSLKILEREDFSKLDRALMGLKVKLNLKDIPRRIECFDISNIQGKEAVGSMVVFVNGLPSKENYRKFKVRQTGEPNDVLMMGEVLSRRFKKAVKMQKGWDLPDLVIVDGGKGQLGAAVQALAKSDLDIPLIGLAKKNEEIWSRSQKSEVSSQKYARIILQKNSEALYLLQRIRDEAHRFAITYFRSLHARSAKISVLDEIEGIGPKTKKELLKKFGSVANIKNASPEEIKETIGLKKAEKIINKLK